MKHQKLFIGTLIIVIAVTFLGYAGLKNSLTYYYEVGELLSQGTSAYGETVRVGGEVMPGVERDVSHLLLRFTLLDIRDKTTSLPVIYQGGSVPDTFQEGRHAIVEGRYTTGGIFEANSIVTKCSAKYIPEEAVPK